MQIAGYFDNLKRANEVVSALKNAGFKKAFLDLKDETIKERNALTNLAGTQMNGSLSNLILESGDRGVDVDKASLSAADPMVSGMAGFEEIMDLSHKITAEVNANQAEEVKRIIIKMGGTLDDPNI